MNTSLSASSDRLKLGSMIRKMMPWDKSTEKVQHDRQYMSQIAKELVQVRRDNPTDKRDLLNAMVKGKDPKTGDTMPDGLISSNMITFLIAGAFVAITFSSPQSFRGHSLCSVRNILHIL